MSQYSHYYPPQPRHHPPPQHPAVSAIYQQHRYPVPPQHAPQQQPRPVHDYRQQPQQAQQHPQYRHPQPQSLPYQYPNTQPHQYVHQQPHAPHVQYSQAPPPQSSFVYQNHSQQPYHPQQQPNFTPPLPPRRATAPVPPASPQRTLPANAPTRSYPESRPIARAPFPSSSSTPTAVLPPAPSLSGVPTMSTSSSHLSQAVSPTAASPRRPLPAPSPSNPSSTVQSPRSPSPVKPALRPNLNAFITPSPPDSQPATPTRSRALPSSPTLPPDLSKIRPGSGVGMGAGLSTALARRGTVSSIAARFDAAGPTVGGSAPGTNGVLPRIPQRASTLPAGTGGAAASADSDSSSESEQDDGNVQDDEIQESDSEPPRTPSPQYGILDLPARSRTSAIADRGVASPARGLSTIVAPAPVPAPAPTPTRTSAPVSAPTPVQRALPTPGRSRTMPQTPSPSPSPASPSPVHVAAHQQLPQVSPERQPYPQLNQSTFPPRGYPVNQPDGHQPPQRQSLAFRLASMSLNGEENGSEERGSSNPGSPLKLNSNSRPVNTAGSQYTNGSQRQHMNLDLDDAPPQSLRRSPSPALSFASSAPSIPMITTPDDHVHTGPNDNPGRGVRASQTSPGTSVPQIVAALFKEEEVRRRGVPIPTISFPDSDFEREGEKFGIPAGAHTGPSIQVIVSDPQPESPSINVSDAGTPSTAVQRQHEVSTTSFSSSTPTILAPGSSYKPVSGGRTLPNPPTTPATQADLNAGSVIRPRGGGLVCGGCQQSIIGRIVSAMGARWHPQCFKCAECGELLEHVSAYEHEGRAYCHLDYHERFAPQCYHCKTPIIDERFITLDDPALGKRTYHEQHFFCAECGDPFLAPKIGDDGAKKGGEINITGDGEFDFEDDDVGFTVYRGHPYCEACHVRLRMPKCKQCKKSIREGMQAVEALGGKWCWECFVCTACEKPFENPSFFQREQKPYCEPCFSLILRNEV